MVGPNDLDDLLPLMRGYCDFYKVAPSDEDLLALSRALIDDPEREGVQLIARNAEGQAIGFATIFWTWSTTEAGRLGVMNDLFVSEAARGTGAADLLIQACRAECASRSS
jgi:GNAT superfamily N-acetyltransferase